MKINSLVCLALAALAPLLAGCVHTANDRTQFGWPWTKDDAEGTYAAPVAAVVQAARDVIKENNGVMRDDNSVDNSLQARIEDTNVYVRVEDSGSTAHVRVQARTRGGAADANLAHEIEKRIALKLAHGS